MPRGRHGLGPLRRIPRAPPRGGEPAPTARHLTCFRPPPIQTFSLLLILVPAETSRHKALGQKLTRLLGESQRQVASGLVSEATVDVAVRRVLRARFELGESPPLADNVFSLGWERAHTHGFLLVVPGDFDPRELVKYRSIELSVADTHHQLAREAARQAVVSQIPPKSHHFQSIQNTLAQL